MIIGIDLDDTIFNTKELQQIYWKKYYQNNPNNEFSENIPSIINDFGNPYIDQFWDTYRIELGFNQTIKENVSKVTNLLHKQGYKLVIITSRPKNKYDNLEDKLKLVMKNNNVHIDKIYTDIRDKASFCKNNNIEILIDDSINHCLSTINKNKKAILFNNDKNYKYIQTTDWLEVYRIIKDKLY